MFKTRSPLNVSLPHCGLWGHWIGLLKDLAPIKTHQAPFQSTLAALWVLCLELIIKAPLTLCVVHTWEFSWRSTLFPISIPSHWHFQTLVWSRPTWGSDCSFSYPASCRVTNTNLLQRIWTYFNEFERTSTYLCFRPKTLSVVYTFELIGAWGQFG